MATRMLGVFRTVVILLVVFLLFDAILGAELAGVVTLLVGGYAFFGEILSRAKDCAIPITKINEYDRMQLQSALDTLTLDVQREARADISKLKLYVIPRDAVNAYSYGVNSVAVTSGMLNACGQMSLTAVLAHEVSHTLNLDACFHRAIFAAVTLLALYLGFMSFAFAALIWLIFLVLALLGVCRGFLGMFVTRGASNLIKSLFTGIQHALVAVYRTVMGAISRHAEFRSDAFAAQLGYGLQLSYFLERFASTDNSQQRSLSDLLYSSHPQPYIRIQRLAEHEQAGSI